jgi:hypothetical protein
VTLNAIGRGFGTARSAGADDRGHRTRVFARDRRRDEGMADHRRDRQAAGAAALGLKRSISS